VAKGTEAGDAGATGFWPAAPAALAAGLAVVPDDEPAKSACDGVAVLPGCVVPAALCASAVLLLSSHAAKTSVIPSTQAIRLIDGHIFIV